MNAGTATVTVKGMGNYTGTATLSFTIKPAQVPAAGSIADVTFNGKEQQPAVSIDGLVEGVDYEVSYSENVNAGTATVTITGKGNYTGTVTLNFTIKPAQIPAVGDIADVTYNGRDQTPAIVIDGLVEGVDYEVSYSNNVNAGTATVTITGKGNYTGTVTTTFTINPASLAGFSDTAVAAYNRMTKDVTALIPGLKEGADYTVTFEQDETTGMIRVTFTGIGNYTGTITMEVEPKDIPDRVDGEPEYPIVTDGNGHRIPYSKEKAGNILVIRDRRNSSTKGIARLSADELRKQARQLHLRADDVSALKEGNIFWVVFIIDDAVLAIPVSALENGAYYVFTLEPDPDRPETWHVYVSINGGERQELAVSISTEGQSELLDQGFTVAANANREQEKKYEIVILSVNGVLEAFTR